MKSLLSEELKITKVADAAVAGTSAVEAAILDMAGYEGVLFLTSFAVAAANNLLQLEQGAKADGSDHTEIVDGAVAPGSSDEDQWIDLYRPRARYVRCIAERGTSSAMGDIWALQYGARNLPADNETAGTIAGQQLVAPDQEEYE